MSPRLLPVFSIWAWLALTPYLLTAFAGADLAADVRQRSLAIVAAVVLHGALLIAFLVVGSLERAVARWPRVRWTLVGVAIAAIAAGRPALLTAMQQALGIDLVTTPSVLRFLMNAVVLAAGLLLLHGLISSVSRARRVEQRLRAVLDGVAEETARISAARARTGETHQLELAREVLDAVGGLVHRRLPADVLAKELRWIARTVVQRAAQRARASDLGDAIGEAHVVPGRDRDGVAAGRDLPALAAGPGWAVAAVTTTLVLPPALSTHGLVPGSLALLTSGVIAFVLAEAIRRVPLPGSRAASLLALAALYLAAGAASIWILVSPLEAEPLHAAYFGYGSVGFAIVATVIAVIASGLTHLRESERRIVAALADAEQHCFAMQRELLVEAAGTGRLLDHAVQGMILAAAYRVESDGDAEDTLESLVDRIEAVMRDGSPPVDTAALIREGLEATLRAWGRTLSIEAEVEDPAIDWLARHPGALAVAHDVITEGLTRTVRFGRNAHAVVRLRRAASAVEIAVHSPGGGLDGDGLAIRGLEQRADSVELLEHGDGLELRVRISTA